MIFRPRRDEYEAKNFGFYQKHYKNYFKSIKHDFRPRRDEYEAKNLMFFPNISPFFFQ